jgi:sialidase-1
VTEPRIDIVCPYSIEWPRNSEGSIAVLRDGRWLLAWSGFYGGFWDDSPAHIMGKWSHDKGETWSEPFIVKENDAEACVASASLAVIDDGSIGLVCCHKKNETDECRPFFQKSSDGGQSFGTDRTMVPDAMTPWYGGSLNGSLFQMSTGRLVAPIYPPQTVMAAYSDDAGESWELSSKGTSVEGPGPYYAYPKGGAAEPVAFERRDGTLLFLFRTALGTLYAAESADGGDTLSDAYDTGLMSPRAPCAVGRIPATGDILIVWNRARPLPNDHGPRAPLTAAISQDEGKTWKNVKDLEPDRDTINTYASLAFDGDLVLVTYSLGQVDVEDKWGTKTSFRSLPALKLARVPYQWFYE